MIGSLGPKGSFTAFALESYLYKHSLNEQVVFYNSFHKIFEALSKKKIDKIFIPIENSIGGDVFSVLEGLVSLDSDYKISAEIHYCIRQSLLAKPGVKLSDIKAIYSHQQSFRQSSIFVDNNFGEVKKYYCDSNSIAAQKISIDNSQDLACIGHQKLADLYNLNVLDSDISNTKDNKTRFVLISKQLSTSSKNDKSSLIFSTQKDKPGSLVDILLELGKRNINLTKISSFPTKAMLGEYLFFIDFQGHCNDDLVRECLDIIRSKCLYFKFLGSYTKGELYA